MAALLVGMSIMAVLMTAAMPTWAHFTKREKEEELIWRGQQYARAIGLFQRKFANTFPPSVDLLVEQRFLRKKYKDPVTEEDFQVIPANGMPPGSVAPPGQSPGGGGAQGRPGSTGAGIFGGGVAAGGGQSGQSLFGQQSQQSSSGQGATQPSIGIQGVVSKSKDASIKIYNGRSKYNEWSFVYLASAQRITAGQQPPQIPPGSTGAPGSGFTPLSGSDRRPAIGRGRDGQSAPSQPSPFGPPPPFGTPPPGNPSPFGRPPARPPGS